MGTRGPHVLVDTTPAKTILVYRNGDAFFVGRRFVLPRRPVATFEALLDQLTEQVEVPFGVRRLFTPTCGHPVLELRALRAGGKYVAAGREPFRKLDYIHIVPRKPAKMRRLKEIKPVVHCDMNVPSRWQILHRTSRHVNVFTNGRPFIPPVKIIIPKFSLMEWNSVLAMIGEKVFPLGGVRKLFTMNGHLLENSKDLQDNHFYVAAGLETFKYFPYWKSSTVPSEVQQKYADIEKCSRGKKKEDAKGKEPHKYDNIPCKGTDSVFYAKEGKKKMLVDHLMQGGTEGDVYKAQTPHTEMQGAPEVKEDDDVQVDVPADQTPADIVKEDEEIRHSCPDFERHKEDNSRMSFKKRVPLRHNTKKKASLKNLSENKKVVPFPEAAFDSQSPVACVTVGIDGIIIDECGSASEKEPYDILEERNTPVLPETPLEIEDQREPPMGQQPQESSLTQSEEQPEEQELLKEPYWRQASQELTPDKQESFEWPSLGRPSQEEIPDRKESFEWPSLGQPSQEQIPDKQESFEQPSPGQKEMTQEKNTKQQIP